MLVHTLELAERGRGGTRPNPIVGAVVVREGRVLGEGFHEAAGKDHAEVVALKAAAPGTAPPLFDGRLRGCTVYVSLEPCAHYGRTAPCADLLIRAGVARVVVAAVDPSDKVAGKGIQRLREAGMEVVVDDGDLSYRARRQNDPFRTWAVTGRPFVTYKYAATLDGRVATPSGHSRWISGEDSRRQVHEMRAAADAVLVGAGTLAADDPQLTARALPVSRQPLRVVVDGALSIARTSALAKTVGEGPVLCVCSEAVPLERRREVAGWGIEVAALETGEDGHLDASAVAALLGSREIQDVLLEGGPRLAGAWWRAGLVDRVVAFLAPIVLGGGGPGPFDGQGPEKMDQAWRLQDVVTTTSGQDLMVSGYVREPY